MSAFFSIWESVDAKLMQSARKTIPFLVYSDDCAKGQLISKCLFGTCHQFSQKSSEKIRLYYYGTGTSSQIVFVRFLFVFWENWRHKKHLEITDLYAAHFQWILIIYNFEGTTYKYERKIIKKHALSLQSSLIWSYFSTGYRTQEVLL